MMLPLMVMIMSRVMKQNQESAAGLSTDQSNGIPTED